MTAIARLVEDAVVYLSWEQRECVSDSFGCGFSDLDAVPTVVFGSGAEVRPVDYMRPGGFSRTSTRGAGGASGVRL